MSFLRIAVLLLGIISVGCGPSASVPSTVSSGPAGPPNAALGNHLDLKETTRFAGFGLVSQATISLQADQLLITASGNDPSIVLPPLALTPPIQFALRVELTSPADSLAEIFYMTNAVQSFVPQHVVSLPVKRGKNVMLFEINDPEFSGGLRFDPGQSAGQYILHGLEIFASGPVSIAKPSSPAATASPPGTP